MDQHPEFVYADDAAVVNSCFEHREKLSKIILHFFNRKNKLVAEVINEFRIVLRDFDRLDSRYEENPLNHVKGYLRKEMRKGSTPGITSVFLGWLCAFHAEYAKEFYKKVGLSTNEMPFRRYPKIPGAWATGDKYKLGSENKKIPSSITTPAFKAIIPQENIVSLQDIGLHPSRPPVILSHSSNISFADFSPCGRYVVVAGRLGIGAPPGAFMWDIGRIAEPDCCRSISLAAEGDVRTATFSPDGKFVVWATARKARLSYAHALAQPLFEMEHAGNISYCSFSNDGTLIASSSWDQTVCIWDAKNGNKIDTICPPIRGDHVVNSAYFTKDKKNY